MRPWLGVFKFGTSLTVALCEYRRIFALGPSLYLCNSFSMFLIYLTFLLCSPCSHILLQNCFVFLLSGCWYVFMHFTHTWRLTFSHCFGMSYFVRIVLSNLDIILVFFLWPVTSHLFPRLLLFVLLVVLLFSYRPNIFQRFTSVFLFFLLS